MSHKINEGYEKGRQPGIIPDSTPVPRYSNVRKWRSLSIPVLRYRGGIIFGLAGDDDDRIISCCVIKCFKSLPLFVPNRWFLKSSS